MVLFLTYPYCLSKLIELLQGMEAKFCKVRVCNEVRVSDQYKSYGVLDQHLEYVLKLILAYLINDLIS